MSPVAGIDASVELQIVGAPALVTHRQDKTKAVDSNTKTL